MSAVARPDGWGSYRLWSLWDMLELNAASFYGVTSALNHMRGRIEELKNAESQQQKESSAAIGIESDPGALEFMREQAQELLDNLLILGTQMTLMSARKLLAEVSGTHGFHWGAVSHWTEEVHFRLIDELSLVKVLAIETRHLDLYQPPAPLFGLEVATKFPSIAYDIEEAAKCLALDRSTASAFHSIRCFEAGIRAMARCLGIPDPTRGAERNWGAVLRAVKIELERRWPSGQLHTGTGGFMWEAHAALSGMQNPWRNATMHLDQKYTAEEAKHIFDVANGFMKKLASQIDEEGNPRT